MKEQIQLPEFGDLMRKLGALGDGQTENSITNDEWEAAYVYRVFVFQKKGSPRQRKRQVSKGSFQKIESDDVLFMQ